MPPIVRFDEKQLAKIAKLFVKPKISSLNIDAILKIVQMLAILAAGTWVLFEYLTYKKQANDTAIVLSQLTVQLAKLNIHERGLEGALKEHDLEKVSSRKVNWERDLTVRKIGEKSKGIGIYRVDLKAKISNNSEKKLDIPFSIIRGFIRPSVAGIEGTGTSGLISRISEPPSTTDKQLTPDQRKWTQVFVQAYALDKRMLDPSIIHITDPKSVDESGGGVGSYMPGEVADFHEVFIVQAHKDHILGFVIDIALNQAGGESGTLYMKEYRLLSDYTLEQNLASKR